jgi:hypothetical protein
VLAGLREFAEHNTRVNIVTTSGSGEGVASLPAAERALFHYLGEFAAPDIDRLRWLQARTGEAPRDLRPAASEHAFLYH